MVCLPAPPLRKDVLADLDGDVKWSGGALFGITGFYDNCCGAGLGSLSTEWSLVREMMNKLYS